MKSGSNGDVPGVCSACDRGMIGAQSDTWRDPLFWETVSSSGGYGISCGTGGRRLSEGSDVSHASSGAASVGGSNEPLVSGKKEQGPKHKNSGSMGQYGLLGAFAFGTREIRDKDVTSRKEEICSAACTLASAMKKKARVTSRSVCVERCCEVLQNTVDGYVCGNETPLLVALVEMVATLSEYVLNESNAESGVLDAMASLCACIRSIGSNVIGRESDCGDSCVVASDNQVHVCQIAMMQVSHLCVSIRDLDGDSGRQDTLRNVGVCIASMSAALFGARTGRHYDVIVTTSLQLIESAKVLLMGEVLVSEECVKWVDDEFVAFTCELAIKALRSETRSNVSTYQNMCRFDLRQAVCYAVGIRELLYAKPKHEKIGKVAKKLAGNIAELEKRVCTVERNGEQKASSVAHDKLVRETKKLLVKLASLLPEGSDPSATLLRDMAGRLLVEWNCAASGLAELHGAEVSRSGKLKKGLRDYMVPLNCSDFLMYLRRRSLVSDLCMSSGPHISGEEGYNKVEWNVGRRVVPADLGAGCDLASIDSYEIPSSVRAGSTDSGVSDDLVSLGSSESGSQSSSVSVTGSGSEVEKSSGMSTPWGAYAYNDGSVTCCIQRDGLSTRELGPRVVRKENSKRTLGNAKKVTEGARYSKKRRLQHGALRKRDVTFNVTFNLQVKTDDAMKVDDDVAAGQLVKLLVAQRLTRVGDSAMTTAAPTQPYTGFTTKKVEPAFGLVIDELRSKLSVPGDSAAPRGRWARDSTSYAASAESCRSRIALCDVGTSESMSSFVRVDSGCTAVGKRSDQREGMVTVTQNQELLAGMKEGDKCGGKRGGIGRGASPMPCTSLENASCCNVGSSAQCGVTTCF